MKLHASSQLLGVYRRANARLKREIGYEDRGNVTELENANNIAAFSHIVRRMEDAYDIPRELLSK